MFQGSNRVSNSSCSSDSNSGSSRKREQQQQQQQQKRNKMKQCPPLTPELKQRNTKRKVRSGVLLVLCSPCRREWLCPSTEMRWKRFRNGVHPVQKAKSHSIEKDSCCLFFFLFLTSISLLDCSVFSDLFHIICTHIHIFLFIELGRK